MKTLLDWSAYQDAGVGDAYADIPKHGGDFAKAVAVCINSRQCEALGKLVMCPSFKVSGNPHLSTGGRVRLLKTALGSDPVDAALTDPVLAQAMDLCVACKGCKRECEANVDMALIKVEYLAQRAARDGWSLRSRLFAHAPRWLHRAPWLKTAGTVAQSQSAAGPVDRAVARDRGQPALAGARGASVQHRGGAR
jgi:glycerol-3-phosphate dehydrogenase subunit C